MNVSDFGEGWVGSPIEQWTVMLLKSGLLFWLGGGLAYLYHIDYFPTLAHLQEWLTTEKMHPVQTLLAIFATLVLLTATASIVKQFDLAVLRLLEGYLLPSWFKQYWLTRLNNQIKTKRQRADELVDKSYRTSLEEMELVDLQQELAMLESLPSEQRLPTRLGNILRYFEERPLQKYGLDTFVCWPHLWLVIPESAKVALTQTRHRLDTLVRIWTWGVLFLVWSYWALWAVWVTLLTLAFSYRWMLPAAREYGQLVEANFDLYRPLLYQTLRWPLPANPKEESQEGIKVTAYLRRGPALDQTEPEFVRLP